MTLALSWFIGEKFGMKFMAGTLLIFAGIFIAGIPKIRQMKEDKIG
jgi:drug/metabolite transporter (DMT)-like permease